MIEQLTYPIIHRATIDTNEHSNKRHSGRQTLVEGMPFHTVYDLQDQEPNRYKPKKGDDHKNCVEYRSEIVIRLVGFLYSP